MRGRHTAITITLKPEEQRALTSLLRSRTLTAGWSRRVRIVLLCAEGDSITAIARKCGITRRHVYKWIERYQAQGMLGLREKQGRGRRPWKPVAKEEA